MLLYDKEAISTSVHINKAIQNQLPPPVIDCSSHSLKKEKKKRKLQFNLLQRINESAVVYGWRVDDFLNELSVTVGVGCGDVNEDLQVLHPVGQCQHFLGGQDIQLHCIPEKG